MSQSSCNSVKSLNVEMVLALLHHMRKSVVVVSKWSPMGSLEVECSIFCREFFGGE